MSIYREHRLSQALLDGLDVESTTMARRLCETCRDGGAEVLNEGCACGAPGCIGVPLRSTALIAVLCCNGRNRVATSSLHGCVTVPLPECRVRLAAVAGRDRYI